ncbi:purine-binding chemotaxis protein CheW [Pseudomonas sp. ABC1]|uniref:chemotaxis protein CheW n=1 Tax=Pseudomonas sp. ABC1 TaxID=2748080 RepID=UPI0015C3C0D4|nr:chemotaxis protein CheW [Pseudomonas sp. ABC1]QLF93800.1 purine-binding chemotaxis protein CheW [Pseudomonas sp. ABC1]
MTDSVLPLPSAQINDCWNRIGVFGDKHCPELERHIHCRNCKVYGAAAIALLDQYGCSLERDGDSYGEGDTHEDEGEQRSLLIFRLGDEWLAIATRCLAEVMPVSPIHVLPHRSSQGLLGVTNVRGTLVACLSLGALLGIASETSRSERRITPRMLILETDDGPLVAPVDEVSGIQRIPLAQITAASHDDARTISRFTAGVTQWHTRSITVLDEAQVMQDMIRSLV